MSSDDGDVRALKDLVESQGWQVFTRLVDEAWGDTATLARVRTLLTKPMQPGSQEAVLFAQAQVLGLLELPDQRLRELTATDPVAQKRPFADLRRIQR